MKYPACNVSQTHQVLLNLLGRMFLHYSRAQNRKQEDYFNKSFNLNPNWIQDFLILFGWLVGWLAGFLFFLGQMKMTGSSKYFGLCE